MAKISSEHTGWNHVVRDAFTRLSDADRIRFLAEQDGWIEDLLDRDDRVVGLIDALSKGKAA